MHIASAHTFKTKVSLSKTMPEFNISRFAFANNPNPSMCNSFIFNLIPYTSDASISTLYLVCINPHSSDIYKQMNSLSIFHLVFYAYSRSPSWLSSI